MSQHENMVYVVSFVLVRVLVFVSVGICAFFCGHVYFLSTLFEASTIRVHAYRKLVVENSFFMHHQLIRHIANNADRFSPAIQHHTA